jgi:hypothetical protein
LAEKEDIERDSQAAEGLLKELAELRDLDERRHAHAPGSPGHERATAEVERRSRRLMERLRDGTWRDLPSQPSADDEPGQSQRNG